MNIGEAARASGISAKMIRHYDETGLIRPAARSEAGYRIYGPAELRQLIFVRRARDLGFSGRQIEALLALWQDRSRASGDVKRIAEAHVEELRGRITALQEMIDTLSALADSCHGDAAPDCAILDGLGAPPGPATRGCRAT